MGAAANVVLVALACLIAGAGFILFSLLCYRQKARRVLGFQSTECTVTSSEVVARGGTGANRHAPLITWEYTIEGTRYGGSGYDAVESSGPKEWAESVVAQFPPGAKCAVYYDDCHRGDSVLTQEPGRGGALCLGTFYALGLLFLAAGIVVGLAAVAMALSAGGRP